MGLTCPSIIGQSKRGAVLFRLGKPNSKINLASLVLDEIFHSRMKEFSFDMQLALRMLW